jgi:hypothetical protein
MCIYVKEGQNFASTLYVQCVRKKYLIFIFRKRIMSCLLGTTLKAGLFQLVIHWEMLLYLYELVHSTCLHLLLHWATFPTNCTVQLLVRISP